MRVRGQCGVGESSLATWYLPLGYCLFHTVWFVVWFVLGLDINTLTLVVSLEAIYITLFIGLGQQAHVERNAKQHEALRKILKK